MKESERLADGQIVSYKYQWVVCYKAAGNHLLFQFADYMEIYNNAMTAADVLSDDALLNSAIGVIGELAPEMEAMVGGFADKSVIISTNQYIQEVKNAVA